MRYNPRFIKSCSLLASLFTSGCAGMAPSTAMHLASFDPLRADPAGISVALVLPDSLLLRDNDVVLTLKQQDKATSTTTEQSFLLKVIDAGSNPVDGVEVKPDQRLQLAKASVADVERLRNWQAAAQKQHSDNPNDSDGGLTIALRGGCTTRPVGKSPLIASVFIRTEKTSRYYRLYNNMDLRKMLGDAVIAKVPPCTT